MVPLRAKVTVFAVLATASLFAGCRAVVGTVPPSGPEAPSVPTAVPVPASCAPAAAPLTRMGYTVQVGAFAVENNARAFAAALTATGLDAFYFPAGSGLFKVRFGDYTSREAAREQAGRLKAEGRIGDYFIVGPADYAAARPGAAPPVIGEPPPSEADLRERLAATAESFIGADYSWGGTTIDSGFDCSGLVRAVYQLNGLAMPRSVGEQYGAGTAVDGDRLMTGDLVFFAAIPGGPLTHVGIYVGNGAFIHAPGSGKKVRRESLGSDYFRAHFSGARAYL
jgi:cell wall-associated NlpC family hydrolase